MPSRRDCLHPDSGCTLLASLFCVPVHFVDFAGNLKT